MDHLQANMKDYGGFADWSKVVGVNQIRWPYAVRIRAVTG